MAIMIIWLAGGVSTFFWVKTMIISKRYKRIFDKYYLPVYEGRVEELTDIIMHLYSTFLSKNFLFDGKEYAFIIDGVRVNHLVKSYFYDVIRYKEFHFSNGDDADDEHIHLTVEEGGSYINDPKQAAYMMKWIVRCKPVLIDKVTEQEATAKQDEIAITVNEILAYMYMISVLGIDFDGDLNDKLVYQMHYRNFEEGAFERICEQLLGA